MSATFKYFITFKDINPRIRWNFEKLFLTLRDHFFWFRSDNFSHSVAPKTLCHGTFMLEWVVSLSFIYTDMYDHFSRCLHSA